MGTRVRTIHTNGHISVLDQAFSQTVEMLKDLSKADRDAFWAKKEIKLPNGDSAFLVREGV